MESFTPCCSSRSRTTGARPRVAAMWRGVLPSRSRPLTSTGELGASVALDRTNSITGSSAHCIARCRIDVPSVRALGSESDVRPPSLSHGGDDCSRMALEIAVVSPLRSDSNTRNNFTDCSIEPPLTVGEDGDAGCWLLLLSLGPPVVAIVGGAFERSFLERLRWWPLDTGELSEACDELGGELLAVFVVLPSAGVDEPSVFEVTLLSMFLTLCDLERLCLQMYVSSSPRPTCAAVAQHAECEHSPFHGSCDWARRAPVAGQEARSG